MKTKDKAALLAGARKVTKVFEALKSIKMAQRVIKIAESITLFRNLEKSATLATLRTIRDCYQFDEFAWIR